MSIAKEFIVNFRKFVINRKTKKKTNLLSTLSTKLTVKMLDPLLTFASIKAETLCLC